MNKERSHITVTIVIPVLNEEKNLHETLQSLNLTHNEELIVVDGGSTDGSVSIAQRFTDKVFVTKKGRGNQMNVGAEKAEGNILLFLHADCILPAGAFDMICQALQNNTVAAGAFDLSIDHPSFRFRIIEFGANLRSHVTAIPYGDQGIFMSKETFNRIGGYADIPLMEDIELLRRLKKIGRIVFISPPIKTSPRRWLKEGPVYTTLRDWTIALSYRFLNVSPERLIKHYKDIR